jgi:hypothetical protein
VENCGHVVQNYKCVDCGASIGKNVNAVEGDRTPFTILIDATLYNEVCDRCIRFGNCP